MSRFRDLLDDITGGKYSPVKRMSSARIIAAGYLILILIGTCLLMLPFASKGEPPRFADAMFTATSASCVTGLIVYDTFSQWTIFGQIVLIILIQIGGMGFMTIISLAALATGRKIGLKERSVLSESVNKPELGGIIRMVKKIATGTFICEGIGALLLSTRFIPKMGLLQGIGNSAFLAISAFCNAGFDLNGKYGAYSSLCEFRSDPVVNITACLLILSVGIGFMVWDDIVKYKLKFRSYRLHSKIALSMTAALTLIGTALFFIFEHNNTAAGLGFGEELLLALFNSVTPRTAGFNTVDTAALSPASTILTICYMFIGGSPGSTAGGVKTVTVAVLFLAAIASMRNDEDINLFGRRLEEDMPKKALSVAAFSLTLIVIGVTAICGIQPELDPTDVVFEAVSAINTVGMTTGITRDLNSISRIIIMLMMYCGRVGSVSFALIFTNTKRYSGVRNPEETISVG